MCLDNENLNRVHECDVGNLVPGVQYRIPPGATMMVLNMPSALPGAKMVANLTTGEVVAEPDYIKLGRDRQGRLYASRFLNPVSP